MLAVVVRARIRTARRRAGAAAMWGFFHGASRLGGLHPAAAPRRHGIERIRDVPYRETGRREHLLDVYRPSGPGPHPVLLYVHGGAFIMLSKETHWIMALGFARRGYLVFNINYRLAPEHRYPAAVEDACAAARWVVENAHRYGGDASRLVYAGESAGANLATTLAIASCYERPEPWAAALYDRDPSPSAVIAACGVLQVSDAERFGRKRRLPTFVRDRLEEVPQLYLPTDGSDTTLADPLSFLEGGHAPSRALPPFFSFAGTRDPLLDDTRRLGRALDQMSVPNEVRYYPGRLHAFHAIVPDPAARACWRHQFAFLDQHVRR